MKVLGIKMTITSIVLISIIVVGVVCVLKMLLSKTTTLELLTDPEHQDRKDIGNHMPDGTHNFDNNKPIESIKPVKPIKTIVPIQTTFAQLE
jgi:hypothetical protein